MDKKVNYITFKRIFTNFLKNAWHSNLKQSKDILYTQLKLKLEIIPALRKEILKNVCEDSVEERYNRFVERKYTELRLDFELISKLKDSLRKETLKNVCETSVNEKFHRHIDLEYTKSQLKFQIISDLRDSLRK